MAIRKCAWCGNGFGWKEPMYYCKDCESVYHWKCLKGGGIVSNEHCPHGHDYTSLRRIDQ
jgi:hypothetical protein